MAYCMGMRSTTRHLDPAAIARFNAEMLKAAQSRPETFLGPQMTEHRKPNPGGGPCEICACPGLRLGTRHRALGFGESSRARYVKHGTDYSGESTGMYLDREGRGV